MPAEAERLRELFVRAVEQGPSWRGYLEGQCAAEPELFQELASLLEHHWAAEGFLGAPLEEETDPRGGDLLGSSIGPYRLIEVLGDGGMGRVYLAQRADEAFHKRVALKLLKPGMDSEEIVRRFRAERQILAALEHPNIARLLDGGTTDRGLPYFVMEHVEGKPIDRFCDEAGLSIPERLKLFQTVCSAVAFAHRNLVVHRDLKPGNILVSRDGAPKLLDFGIAKLLNPELSALAPAPTLARQRPMTPEYASPEQLRGEPITTASDVYGLGLLLFELLAGKTPWREGREAGAREPTLEAPRPSTVVAKWASAQEGLELARHRGEADARKLARRLAGDLDNIVQRALAADPRRRYSSAEALAEDLERHLQGQPVEARPSTLAYRTGKLVARHPLGVALGGTALLALLGFGIAMALLAHRLSEEKTRAEREAARAEQVTQVLTDVFKVADPFGKDPQSLTAREILDSGAERVQRDLQGQPEVQADLMETLGQVYLNLQLPEQAAFFTEAALKARERAYGPESAKVADSLRNLARIKNFQGALGEARDLAKRALELRQRLLGPEHPLVAASWNDLGIIDLRLERYNEARAELQASLELKQRLPGTSPDELARTHNNLGVALWRLGQLGEAERTLRKVLDFRQARGQGDRVADVLDNLALVVDEARGPLAGEPLHRRALELREKIYGPEHTRVADTLTNLALVLMGQGRFAEAGTHLERALAIRRKVLGAEHPEVGLTLAALGEVATGRGEFDRALELQEEGLAMRRRLLGPDNPESLESQVLLANVRLARKDYALAEQGYREVLAVRRRTLGEKDLQVGLGLEALARCLLAEGNWQGARDAAREAVEIASSATPPPALPLARALTLLGGSLVTGGQMADAEPLLLEALAVLETQAGESAPATQEALRQLVSLHQRRNSPKAALYRARLHPGAAPLPSTAR